MTSLRHIYRLFPALAALAVALPAAAQETAAADSFDVSRMVVEIPGSPSDADLDIAVPSFIRRQANRIALNGADWAPLRAALERSAAEPASIVMIGDSHIQADISSGLTRDLLQYDFGNAGRGLVSPLKISGTNEPADYSIQSRNSWIPVKLMSQPWRQTVGFTGASIRPSSASSDITVSTSEKDGDAYNPFSSVTLFHQGKMTVSSVTSAGRSVPFRSIPSHDYTQILLERPVTDLTVSFSSGGDLTLFGAMLSADTPGVFYHAIGNNGAAYETYNRIGNVGAGIAPLSPDLVIVSLGTNEAFGRFDAQTFARSVDRLVSNIRQANPSAQILLTTPMECQRSVSTTKKVRVKSRKGRYRTVNRTSRTYAVNRNIAPIRQAILDYGREHNIAVYDWYDVAGGAGASTSWINRGLFAKDRVHHSRTGYLLEGRLLYEALMDAVRNAPASR